MLHRRTVLHRRNLVRPGTFKLASGIEPSSTEAQGQGESKTGGPGSHPAGNTRVIHIGGLAICTDGARVQTPAVVTFINLCDRVSNRHTLHSTPTTPSRIMIFLGAYDSRCLRP